MLRDQELEDIYDGNFYSPDDFVMIGCHDCAGCSDCCRQTGDTIILDPWDMYMLSKGTGKVFTDMIEKEIEIRLVDGLILPNLMQHHESSDAQDAQKKESPYDHCAFLSEEGRCLIHAWRPGLCRLYPMGRCYEGDQFRYILQKDECSRQNRYPVKLRDWLEIPDLESYECFVRDWHRFLRQAGNASAKLTEKSSDSVMRYILQVFFVEPYRTGRPFLPQYENRMRICRQALHAILPQAGTGPLQ